MPLLNLYYSLRPLIPRPLQIYFRSRVARRRRQGVAGAWPILEGAGAPPPNWQGWPGGKRFAFVLTHDVDTRLGLHRCHKLMALEERLGFRSAFYLVPEGRYDNSPEIREEMARRGFEVGVHGLRHDGRLFRSRKLFEQRAHRINRYLKDWGAVGFRAPMMIRNLDWIHCLDIEYDASTFDTDPFEPQPQGVGTVFPFWVDGGAAGHHCFAEIPYTVPQDFSMFVLLGEHDVSLWKRKIDWLAARGGMALLDSHPDYMNLDNRPSRREEYSASHYEEILAYVATRYRGEFWHVLPREVTGFCRHTPGVEVRRMPRKVCMVAYAFYENDNRIRRYAETLTQRGDEVTALALRREAQARHGMVHGVRVHRIQKRTRNEGGPLDYLFRLLRFWCRSSVALSSLHWKAPFDLIHVHSVPDFEVFAAWLPKRMGAKVILDIHDIVPEFYASKFGVTRTSLLFRALARIERASASFADHVIVANHLWHKTLTTRSVSADRCSVILNYPDPELFSPHHRNREDGKFRVIYPGGLHWHQGLDIAIRAFVTVKRQVPNVEFHIHGEGSEESTLKELVASLGLEDVVLFKGVVGLADMAQVMANADLGIVPKRADSFGNEAYSTKILEYMSQGLPVLASRTRIDTYYFNDSVVEFFESGNVQALAQAMLSMIQDDARRQRLSERSRNHFRTNNWGLKKQEYLYIIDSLLLSPHAGTTPFSAPHAEQGHMLGSSRQDDDAVRKGPGEGHAEGAGTDRETGPQGA